LNNKFLLLLLSFLFAVVLSSCGYYPLEPNYGFVVSNVGNRSSIRSPNGNETCPGGLQAQLSFPASGVSVKSELVPMGETYTSKIAHGGKAGDSKIIEAWCFGQNREELGYNKRVGELTGGSRVYQIEVYPPAIVKSGPSPCPIDTEGRGLKFPCIEGF
jgi:hypothetical protein